MAPCIPGPVPVVWASHWVTTSVWLGFLHSSSKLLERGYSKKGFSQPSVGSSRTPLLLPRPGGTSVEDSLGESQGHWTLRLSGRNNKKCTAVFHLPHPPSLTCLWRGSCGELSEIMNRKHLAQHLIHNNHSIKSNLLLVFGSSLARPSFFWAHSSSTSLSLSAHIKSKFFPFWKLILKEDLGGEMGEIWDLNGTQVVI